MKKKLGNKRIENNAQKTRVSSSSSRHIWTGNMQIYKRAGDYTLVGELGNDPIGEICQILVEVFTDEFIRAVMSRSPSF